MAYPSNLHFNVFCTTGGKRLIYRQHGLSATRWRTSQGGGTNAGTGKNASAGEKILPTGGSPAGTWL